MLILVSVTISMAVNEGLFDYAGDAVSKTQEALDAEKELSNGRIQVGGKWYASIDDYLKGKELIFSYEEAEKDENGMLTTNATYTYSGRNVITYVPVSKPNNPSCNYISQVNAKIVSEAMYAESTAVQSSLIDSYAWDTIVNWMESENEGIALNSTNYGNYLNSSMELTNAHFKKIYTF